MPPDETVLEVRGLKKQYGTAEVLRGVDLQVTRADVFSIIGPNGCGKSTFLRCLNLLEIYQEGEVRLRGEVVSQGQPEKQPLTGVQQLRARELRRRVGMVFQQFNLFPHMNVLHNVMCGPIHVLRKSKPEAAAIAENMLKKVGLWEKQANHPSTLSGGQQQRVAIARSLVNDPHVILADEPTGNLDSHTSDEIMRLLRTLNEAGKTIIMVTHENDIAAWARRVVRMRDGRVETDERNDRPPVAHATSTEVLASSAPTLLGARIP